MDSIINYGVINMNKIIFNSMQMEMLERNPNVDKVSDRSITYNPNFKIKAVKENARGKGPQQIFLEHGFDLSVIGSSKPNECIKRWRRTYQSQGEAGLLTDRRGKGSTGNPGKEALTDEQRLKKAEARIAYLEAENDFLKKLEELERQAIKKRT